MDNRAADALVHHGWELLSMTLVLHIDAILDLSIHRRHDISDLKANSAHFDQILLVKADAWHLHLRAAVVANYSPNLFFRLFL